MDLTKIIDLLKTVLVIFRIVKRAKNEVEK